RGPARNPLVGERLRPAWACSRTPLHPSKSAANNFTRPLATSLGRLLLGPAALPQPGTPGEVPGQGRFGLGQGLEGPAIDLVDQRVGLERAPTALHPDILDGWGGRAGERPGGARALHDLLVRQVGVLPQHAPGHLNGDALAR